MGGAAVAPRGCSRGCGYRGGDGPSRSAQSQPRLCCENSALSREGGGRKHGEGRAGRQGSAGLSRKRCAPRPIAQHPGPGPHPAPPPPPCPDPPPPGPAPQPRTPSGGAAPAAPEVRCVSRRFLCRSAPKRSPALRVAAFTSCSRAGAFPLGSPAIAPLPLPMPDPLRAKPPLFCSVLKDASRKQRLRCSEFPSPLTPLCFKRRTAPCTARPASVPAVIAAVPRQRLPKKAIDGDAASSPIRRGGIAGALHTPALGAASCHCAEGGGQAWGHSPGARLSSEGGGAALGVLHHSCPCREGAAP